MHVKYECDNDKKHYDRDRKRAKASVWVCAREREKKKECFKSRKYYLMLHCIVLLMLIHIEAHRLVYFNIKCNWCFDTNTHTQAFTILSMLMIYDLSSFIRKSTIVFDVQCRIPLNMESLKYIAWCNISSYEVIFYLFVRIQLLYPSLWHIEIPLSTPTRCHRNLKSLELFLQKFS